MGTMGLLKTQAVALAIGLSAPALASADFAVIPDAHVEWAEDLVDSIDPADNLYGSEPTTYLFWEGVDGHAKSENRTVCSTFVTRLLKQAYDYTSTQITTLMGCASPVAARYYDLMAAQENTPFLRVTRIDDVMPRDFLAVKYNDKSCAYECGTYTHTATCDTTGHVMLVTGEPVKIAPRAPYVIGTEQYAVTVIDSSSSPHGDLDTRRNADLDPGTGLPVNDQGVGEGTLRLFVHSSTGEIVGYSWSTKAYSTFYANTVRPFAVGRFVLPVW